MQVSDLKAITKVHLWFAQTLLNCVHVYLYVHKGYTYSNWLSLFKLVISIQQMASEICDDTKVSIYIS